MRAITVRRPLVALGVALAILAVTLLGVDRAQANGEPCSEPRWGGHGPCLVLWSSNGILATFWDGGFQFFAYWNYYSEATFYAAPVSGHQAQITYEEQENWTTSLWPAGTWLVSQYISLYGYNFSIPGCGYSKCYLSYLGIGWNYAGGDYDYWNYAWYSPPYPYSDDNSQVKASAGLFPSSGATAAFNNVRSNCANLTAWGPTPC